MRIDTVFLPSLLLYLSNTTKHIASWRQKRVGCGLSQLKSCEPRVFECVGA
jgi:hypothetical protein